MYSFPVADLISNGSDLNNSVDKKDPVVIALKEWIDKEYEGGRQTSLSNHEIEEKIEEFSNGRFCRL